MSRTHTGTARSRVGSSRIAPSPGFALAVVIAYAAAFTVTAATSGIPYTQWFASPSNVWRCAVLPLAVGTVLLLAFQAWARWDGVFRDRPRMTTSALLRIAVVVFAAGIVAHLVFVDWAGLDPAIVPPILVTGVLVGFCEELLFRGVLVRGLRTDGRSEAFVVVASSVTFGLFHLTNLITGSPVAAVANQVVAATFTGVILYAVRRLTGLLVAGMIAHGLWDVSLFLPTTAATTASSLVALVFLVLVPVAGLLALLSVVTRERRTPRRRPGLA